MSLPGLRLGVDGGGMKTRAVVADREGQVLGRGLGAASNYKRVGFDKACAAIASAVAEALDNAGLGAGAAPPRDAAIAAACFGLAGVDGAEDEARISGWVRDEGVATRFSVVNDTELVLAAGTPEGWGVVLISGTGSNCIARSPDGQTLRVGGWGPALGDEGSGYRIGRQALRAATQAADGRGGANALLAMVLRHWSLADAATLITYVYRPEMTHADIASLTGPVMDLAEQGDPDARGILDEAARDLALQVDTAVTRMGVARPPLALTGGVLRRPAFRSAMRSAVAADLGPVAFVDEPDRGALILAERLARETSS